jgi:hypothetical protein
VQTGIALFADRVGMDFVSQFFLEQMLGLGYFATSITLNILAVSPQMVCCCCTALAPRHKYPLPRSGQHLHIYECPFCIH